MPRSKVGGLPGPWEEKAGVIQLDSAPRRQRKQLHEGETSGILTDGELQSHVDDASDVLVTEKGLSGSSRVPSAAHHVRGPEGVSSPQGSERQSPEKQLESSGSRSQGLASESEYAYGAEEGTRQPFTEKSSVNSQGVHKLVFTARNFGNKNGGTIYQMLKADAFVLVPTREKAVLSYD